MSARHLEHDWFPDALPENVAIGERSWLYSSFAFRHFQAKSARALEIGDDTGLYDGTFFDLGQDAEVRIGSFVTVVSAIFATNGRIRIGDYAFIAHEVVFADQPFAGPPHLCPASRGHGIIVGVNAWIGARATLLDGAVIGRNAIVGAASVVDFVVPDDCVAAGNPARIVR